MTGGANAARAYPSSPCTKKTQQELEQMQAVKDENIRLTTQLGSLQAHYEEMQTRQARLIEALMRRIEALSKEAGQEYSKGYLEAPWERGDVPKRGGE